MPQRKCYPALGPAIERLPDASERLIGNIVGSMKGIPRRIQELQIQHVYKADPAYGTELAKGLGLNIENIVAAGKKVTAAD